jgi:Arc/MetJ-type ribon-helix-helix transcriptional regulator
MVIYNGIQNMAMRKVTVAMTDQMYKDLEKETKKRRLASVAETTRVLIGEYLWHNNEA